MPITIYGIKNCDTMKKARAFLDKHKIDYAFLVRDPYELLAGRPGQARGLGQEGRLGGAAQQSGHDLQEAA